MGTSLTHIIAALLVAAGSDTTDQPRIVVREALRAVEGDSARRAAAGWEERLRRNSADRAAALGLATLARFSYDYADAERRYRQLFESDSTRLDRFAVYASLGYGQALYTRGLLVAADSHFTRALTAARVTEDPVAEAEALSELSMVRAISTGLDSGLVLVDRATRLTPPNELDIQAANHCRRAVLLAVATRADAASEAILGAEAARRAGERRLEAFCLRTLALALKLRADPDSSLALLRRVIPLQREARDRSALAESLLRTSDILLSRGDYGEAKDVMRRALIEGEASRNLLAVASANLSLGSLALMLNDHASAAEHVNRAIAMFEAQGDVGGVMMARAFLPDVALAGGDLVEARRQAQEVLRWYQETKEAPNEFEMHRGLASIAMRERDWVEASRALSAARDLARRHGISMWSEGLAFDYGRLALLRGDLAAAERFFLDDLRRHAPDRRVHRHGTRMRLAEIYARRGELARAEQEMVSAGDDLDAWRATLTDSELRVLAFQATRAEQNDRNASVARVLAALAAGGRTGSAFQLAERRRARELAERLVQSGALRPADDASRLVIQKTRRLPGLVTVEDVAAAIPDDSTALLEYVTGADGAPTTLFVLTRSGRNGVARAHILAPIDSLSERVTRFVALLEGGGDPRALARALGAALLDPALAALGPEVTRLVVVPDGPLHRLPFDALQLADGRYVVERYAVGLVPSATVLAALLRRRGEDRGQGGDEPPVRVLAFGDPAFAGETAASGDAQSREYRSAFAARGGLPRLGESGREARLVARFARDAEVRLREDASAAYLKRAPLSAYRIIHYVTHALVDERSVARTALALAPGGGESGYVAPGELASLRLDVDLVVLSACRTAGGVVVDGEGVQGLTAPLLQAGTRSVVATSWRIGDRSTVGLVEEFYNGLARRLPVSEALRAAKLEALRRGAPPSEWAAFTVVGDPLVRIPLEAPRPLRGWWLAAPALAGALAAAYSLRKRKRRGVDRA